MHSNVDCSEFFGRAKTKYFVAKHVYTRRFVRDRSFLEVLILERAWPVWYGSEMICFCSIPWTDNVHFVHEQDFGFGVLPVARFVRQFVYDKPAQTTEIREEVLQMLAYISTSSSEY